MGLRRLITEFLWPPSAPSSDADYHIVSKYSSRRIKRAQTMGLRRLITEFLWPPSAPSSDADYHSIKVLVKTNQTSPNSMGLRRLITEFLWPPSSSIIRPWLPYSIKTPHARVDVHCASERSNFVNYICTHLNVFRSAARGPARTSDDVARSDDRPQLFSRPPPPA
ncbi:hypothetical protein EVAR_5528_1 [Eumeta japonica]|uniref:Uncharacterized protein n=1 Tax=Eumeta variegata TaxID=151549 RepID=A0A4C1T959_EUMVA|nr:hypothetical protein EVAR_5528_1 [Eumeta japonica]